jgi:signal transduction histidine kinase
MLHLRDYPIAKQLTWLNLLVTTVALLQSCSAFLVYDVERSKIPIRMDISASLGRLPREVEITIFRILQESLTNIHRHSGSRDAIIRIAREAHEVSLEVKDHGRGMAKRGAGAEPEVGVQGMQERARQLGGSLEIRAGSERYIRDCCSSSCGRRSRVDGDTPG